MNKQKMETIKEVTKDAVGLVGYSGAALAGVMACLTFGYAGAGKSKLLQFAVDVGAYAVGHYAGNLAFERIGKDVDWIFSLLSDAADAYDVMSNSAEEAK